MCWFNASAVKFKIQRHYDATVPALVHINILSCRTDFIPQHSGMLIQQLIFREVLHGSFGIENAQTYETKLETLIFCIHSYVPQEWRDQALRKTDYILQ